MPILIDLPKAASKDTKRGYKSRAVARAVFKGDIEWLGMEGAGREWLIELNGWHSISINLLIQKSKHERK